LGGDSGQIDARIFDTRVIIPFTPLVPNAQVVFHYFSKRQEMRDLRDLRLMPQYKHRGSTCLLIELPQRRNEAFKICASTAENAPARFMTVPAHSYPQKLRITTLMFFDSRNRVNSFSFLKPAVEIQTAEKLAKINA
ncbi:MAG: hypothetical protein LBB65_03560, partial [Burkholderiales bacterium]|jgi:hypothetical protein|nr:hypothetical protein [Burkholderiales bacterium]